MQQEEINTPEPTVEPVVQTELEIHTKKLPPQRHFLALFFLSFLWGTFGVDRFYMGLVGTGILKLVTLGGLGLWTLSDFIIIMTGTFRDKQGRPALQFEEYKAFASKTILWFSVVVGLVVLLNGLLLVFVVFQFMNGSLGGSIPGLDVLMGGSQQDTINSLIAQ